jgi:multicomponent Na+:H+ antiporter subunit G
MAFADLAASVLLLTGCVLMLIASIGLHRFDDVFSRIHAATKASTLGVVFVVAGTATQVDELGDVVKLLITVVLQLVSAPVAAHTVGRAAYWTGTELSPANAIDQLAESDLEG